MFIETGILIGDDPVEDQELAQSLSESFAFMPRRANNAAVIGPIREDDEESRVIVRDRIERLQQAIYGLIAEGAEEFDDSDWLTHMFIEGVYARELVIPAGIAVIGKLHKYPRICIISGGECTFVTEFGTQRVEAPFAMVAPAGSKTAVYAHTDTTWTAIHGTHETDLKKLDELLIARDHAEYQRFLEQED